MRSVAVYVERGHVCVDVPADRLADHEDNVFGVNLSVTVYIAVHKGLELRTVGGYGEIGADRSIVGCGIAGGIFHSDVGDKV